MYVVDPSLQNIESQYEAYYRVHLLKECAFLMARVLLPIFLRPVDPRPKMEADPKLPPTFSVHGYGVLVHPVSHQTLPPIHLTSTVSIAHINVYVMLRLREEWLEVAKIGGTQMANLPGYQTLYRYDLGVESFVARACSFLDEIHALTTLEEQQSSSCTPFLYWLQCIRALALSKIASLMTFKDNVQKRHLAQLQFATPGVTHSTPGPATGFDDLDSRAIFQMALSQTTPTRAQLGVASSPSLGFSSIAHLTPSARILLGVANWPLHIMAIDAMEDDLSNELLDCCANSHADWPLDAPENCWRLPASASEFINSWSLEAPALIMKSACVIAPFLFQCTHNCFVYSNIQSFSFVIPFALSFYTMIRFRLLVHFISQLLSWASTWPSRP